MRCKPPYFPLALLIEMFARIPHTRLILVIETTESSLPLVEAVVQYIKAKEPRVEIDVKTYQKTSGLAADFLREYWKLMGNN